MGNNEVTIEMSNQKEPPSSEIPQFWNDNRDALLTYIESCLIGVRGLVTDADNAAPLAATVTVVGREHEIYTDPDVGDYHRMLLPGIYDLRFEADGYDPMVVEQVEILDGDATLLDVALAPPPRIETPNGGESLPVDVETLIEWTGKPGVRYHVQHTANYGDFNFVADGFEGGVLDDAYGTGGDAVWLVTEQEAHNGAHAARAGDIENNEVSWLTRTAGGGALSFWYRVSSEADFDFFNFYIDGELVFQDSGQTPWKPFETELPNGQHELKWEYIKDVNTSVPADTVWIDDVQLVDDRTAWNDVIDLTPPGASATTWMPTEVSDACKVRVRANYGDDAWGIWDESDELFAVVESTPCPEDVNDDGFVDIDDLFALLNVWGLCDDCVEDIDGDGVVDIDDLFAVLNAWGPCK
jgi:hypothetical protein